MTTSGCIIPIRGIKSGKQRIRKCFPPSKDSEISNLLSLILGRVLRYCADCFNPIWIMTKNPADVQANVKNTANRIFRDPDASLNDSLAIAAREMAPIADSLAVITPDLPLLRSDDVYELLGSFNGKNCAIAPSKDVGTSGLIIPLDNSSLLSEFEFQFGANSFSRHLEAFSKANLDYQVVRSKGFLWDLDDLEDLQGILKTQIHLLPDSMEEKIRSLILSRYVS